MAMPTDVKNPRRWRQLRLGVLMARVAPALGVAGFLLFGPALARTLWRANFRRSEGTPLGLGMGLVEMARSLILVILAHGRATLAWLVSSVVAACLVNVFILLAVVAALMGNLSRPGFFKPIVAIMVGGLVSLPVALFVLVREVRK